MNQSVVVSLLLAIHELSRLRSVYLDWCVEEMQWQAECGLTRVSLLIQAGDVMRKSGRGSGMEMG